MTKPQTAAKPKATMRKLELNPASGVDVLGEPTKPLLVKGQRVGFTHSEADALLKLVNGHGVPICRIVRKG